MNPVQAPAVPVLLPPAAGAGIPPAVVPPAVPAAGPVFALSPGNYNSHMCLDFSSGSRDISLFYKGSAPLSIIYDGSNLEMFLSVFNDRAHFYSWENILNIPTVNGIKNLVKEHGQITTEEVAKHVATYSAAATREAQNCVMMYTCLRHSVAATKLADLDVDFRFYCQQGPTYLKFITIDARFHI